MDVAPERDAQAVAENLSCGLHGAASWAQRWQSGAREEVAREVYGSCRKPVEGYFRSRRCSPEECQELTQAALSRALEGLAGYRGEASFESWLLQIAKSVLHKHLRHAGAAKRSAPTETLEALAGARQARTEPDQLRRTLRREELERARRALDQLSGSQRRALALFCVQERSYREIALVLRVSVGRVKSLISEARQRLRQSLGEYQGSQSPRGEP